jgi:hypothetical protein
MHSVQAMTYRAQCIGNAGKASVDMYTKDNVLYLRYSSSLGAADFPFYEGAVSKNSLPFIKIAETELASLDHEVLLSWPVEKCTFNEERPLMMACNGAATFVLPEHTKLESYTLFTAMDKEQSLTYSYDIFKIRWGIEGEYFHHSLMLPFDPKLCWAEFVK